MQRYVHIFMAIIISSEKEPLLSFYICTAFNDSEITPPEEGNVINTQHTAIIANSHISHIHNSHLKRKIICLYIDVHVNYRIVLCCWL